MCAVGCLISDEAYNPKIEGQASWDVRVLAALGESGIPTHGTMKTLLRNLQDLHDRIDTIHWKTYLQDLARPCKTTQPHMEGRT